ncbi:MAG: Septum formation initiator [Oscillospiraceae bacterium]|jgi:cell division protein FtsB|nr:Septum formation initiator [Oscillospiraceae bacterium]
MHKRKAKKNRSFILTLAIIIFSGYAIVALASSQVKIAQQKREYLDLKKSYEQKLVLNNELDYALDNHGEKEYYEKKARENGYVNPDEQVFIDMP